ncbi:unnamed protein product [Merluccius merluccius]
MGGGTGCAFGEGFHGTLQIHFLEATQGGAAAGLPAVGHASGSILDRQGSPEGGEQGRVTPHQHLRGEVRDEINRPLEHPLSGLDFDRGRGVLPGLPVDKGLYPRGYSRPPGSSRM